MSKRVDTQIARSASNRTKRTWLKEVINLVDAGHDSSFIKSWAEKRLNRESLEEE